MGARQGSSRPSAPRASLFKELNMACDFIMDNCLRLTVRGVTVYES